MPGQPPRRGPAPHTGQATPGNGFHGELEATMITGAMSIALPHMADRRCHSFPGGFPVSESQLVGYRTAFAIGLYNDLLAS